MRRACGIAEKLCYVSKTQMPSHRPSLKDPSASLAGSHGRKPRRPPSPPKNPPSPQHWTGTGKFLRHRKLWPDAATPHTCINLAVLAADKAITAAVIRKSVLDSPGHYVYGALTFPTDKANAMKFYITAGFSEQDAQLLTEGMTETYSGDQEVPDVEHSGAAAIFQATALPDVSSVPETTTSNR